jgi:hypothetical protein
MEPYENPNEPCSACKGTGIYENAICPICKGDKTNRAWAKKGLDLKKYDLRILDQHIAEQRGRLAKYRAAEQTESMRETIQYSEETIAANERIRAERIAEIDKIESAIHSR